MEIIKEKRLSWCGHVKRIPENRIQLKKLNWTAEGEQNADRENAGWVENAEVWRERDYVNKIIWVGIFGGGSRLFWVEGEPLYSGIIINY